MCRSAPLKRYIDIAYYLGIIEKIHDYSKHEPCGPCWSMPSKSGVRGTSRSEKIIHGCDSTSSGALKPRGVWQRTP
jgi:hypothetical protein